MADSHDAVDTAIAQIDRLRKVLKRNRSVQVTSSEERSIVKATAHSWFKNHRKQVQEKLDSQLLNASDEYYRNLLIASDRFSSRAKYDSLLKNIRKELINIDGLILTATQNINSQGQATTDEPPGFDPLIADAQMRDILKNRWRECYSCIKGCAPLAATVMMGGLLEALLLARINKEQNKAIIFTARTAPKDKSTGKTLPLKEWTLMHYIEVAHELKWISQSAKDVGEVLRDYRNYIHPYKEFSHGIQLGEDDALLFWEVSKSIARQVIKS
jgi:hypothetical protein